MKQRIVSWGVWGCLMMLGGCGDGGDGGGFPPVDPNGPPVAVRPENLVVLPATGPVTHVQVQNLRDQTYRGTVHLTCPSEWKLNTTSKPVVIEPRQLVRVPFAIERGVDAPGNSYSFEVRAVGDDGTEVVRDRPVVVASTPYFKPVIDGGLSDWVDAIPVTFVTGGKKTTVSTYWSRRNYSLLVAVEEDAQRMMGTADTFDAVQIAISSAGSKTPRAVGDPAQRHEFLLTAAASGAKCYLLTRPGDGLAAGQKARPLEGLASGDVQLRVFRDEGVTYYECAIPLKTMPGIRAEPGREYRFSLLVHDPDGTGLRDWGEGVGLWPWQRNRLAWSQWRGAVWPDTPPYDNKIEWGFCSSKR